MRAARVVLAAAVLLTVGCTGTRPPNARGVNPSQAPASASPASAPAPAGSAPAGTYAVNRSTETFTRTGRRLTTTIWYPARAGKAAPGRFPVVLFSHGLGGLPGDYATLLAEWAAAGFVVVAPAYPHTSRGSAIEVTDVLNQPADASYVLSQVLADSGPLNGHVDAEHVAAAGHSAGGITTVGLFTRSRDNRLRAGVVLAGNSLGFGTGYQGPAADMLFVHGTADQVVPYSMGKAAYDPVPWPKAMLTLPGAGHILPTGSRAWKVFAASTTDFLRWALYGDPTAKGRLPADAVPGGELDDHL